MTNENEKTVTVLKYEIWFTKKTKDRVKNHWFSFPNDLFTHPDFEELTAEEWKWFLFLVTICSKVKKGTIKVSLSNAVRVGNLDKTAFESMMRKLNSNQVGFGNCPQHQQATSGPDAGPEQAPTGPPQTEQNKTDITEQTEQDIPDLSPAAADLVIFLKKNDLVVQVLPGIIPAIIESWLKYERFWLRQGIADAILNRMSKANVRKPSELNDWGTTLITWFKIEKYPRLDPNYVQTEDLLNLSQTANTQNSEVQHAG